MKSKGILSMLRFVFFTVFILVLILGAVMITVLNTYKGAVKAYVNDTFIGYFSSEQQFDEVYNDLVTEKQNIDENVKVYLEQEPTFETCYIRSSVFETENVYTNLRAKLLTEYTVYNVAVNDEVKMTFSTQDEANKYAESLKAQVSKLKTEVRAEKKSELGEITSIERADSILKDIVDRNKPVSTKNNSYDYSSTSTDEQASQTVANAALMQGGIWPTTARYISSYYGWRWGSIHTGTDIAGRGGDPIYAYKAGLVTFSGWVKSYGYMIKLDHGNGLSTWYAHCSKLLVKAGQEVSQGDTIALMGSTGWSTGNHLHFEVRINGVHTNSYPYIADYK